MGASLDPNLVIREFIQSTAASAYTACSGRVYAHAIPQQNMGLPCISFDIQSGRSEPHAPIYDPMIVVIRVWAPRGQGAEARRIYNLLRDGIHGRSRIATTTGHIIYCNENQPGQDLTDFDTEIASVLSYWSVGMYATAT